MSSHAVVEITKARMREFYREPGALFWVFVFPVLMAVVLGTAFGQRPIAEPIVAVVDDSESPWLVAALEKYPIQIERLSQNDAHLALKKGRIDLIIASDRKAEVTYIYDQSQEKNRLARLEADRMLEASLGQTPKITATDHTPRSTGTRYIDFVIPGLLGLNIMGGSIWGIGYSLVLARRRKVLKRLSATPMRRSHFLLGYLLFRLMFLSWEASALIVFAMAAFSVVIQGSLLLVAFIAILGAFAFTGMGLMVAARIESLEAANGWLNFLMLPSWLLSGTFFSYLRFPESLHLPIRLLPLTALNDAMRGIFNEGAGLTDLSFEMAVLTIWGAVSFAVALRIFKWQ